MKAYLVTTAKKGVFFGYHATGKISSTNQITLTNARLCVYWSVAMKGFMGLASIGPDDECRIGPSVESITLTEVTSVSLCSEKAVKNWEKQPWQ